MLHRERRKGVVTATVLYKGGVTPVQKLGM
jgi:hypothetical protein